MFDQADSIRAAAAVAMAPLPVPSQPRSRATQERLIDAGWEILQTTPWEEVSIPEIAERAGRSVGAFYHHFTGKEEFLAYLMQRWFEHGYASSERALAPAEPEALIDAYLTDVITRLSRNRFLWRIALQRAVTDPDFWGPIRRLGAYRLALLADRLGEARGTPLAAEERRQLAFATQVFNSVINNSAMINPGPIDVDDPQFFPTMRRLFREMCAFDLP